MEQVIPTVKDGKMSKAHINGRREGETFVVFHCPGCQNAHMISYPKWDWNQSLDKPTFSPSILVNQHDALTRCHSFVKDGKIQFLGDCYHGLKNQTVELPDWETHWGQKSNA